MNEKKAPAAVKSLSNSRHLNIGVIGYGGRGGHLVRGAGFATTGWTNRASENAQKNKLDKQFETFMTQEDLNCSLVGVSDLFDVRADQGIDASKNETRPGGKPKSSAKKYRRYQDLLANDEIDAVIIATPDHWHAKIVTDAAKAGKHVYCEKGLTRTFDEVIDVYDTVKETGITFQLGHQNRQVEANEKAKQIYKQGLLGPVNLVEIATNRNSPWGAWVWDIHPKGNAKTIDWETFQKPSPNKIPFGEEALKRFLDGGVGTIMEQVFPVIYYHMTLTPLIRSWKLVYQNMPHPLVVFIFTKMAEMFRMYGMQPLNIQIIKMAA